MLQPSSSRDAALDKLGKKADHLKDTLKVLDRLTDEAGQLLDSLGAGLAHLNDLTAPIKSRASALTVAQANIAAAKGRVDELVEHVSTSRRVSSSPITHVASASTSSQCTLPQPLDSTSQHSTAQHSHSHSHRLAGRTRAGWCRPFAACQAVCFLAAAAAARAGHMHSPSWTPVQGRWQIRGSFCSCQGPWVACMSSSSCTEPAAPQCSCCRSCCTAQLLHDSLPPWWSVAVQQLGATLVLAGRLQHPVRPSKILPTPPPCCHPHPSPSTTLRSATERPNTSCPQQPLPAATPYP
jgi:hypothetical protein